MTPRILFRTAAIAEAVTWAFLLVAMFFKYVLRSTDALVPPAGGAHGFVFLCFVGVTVFVWVNQKWGVVTGLLGLVSAVIPFASIVFDVVMDRRGALGGVWRLAPGRERPRGVVEQVQAWVLRSPLVAGIAALAVVAVVFGALLVIGPPFSSRS
jgi:integral membrane protein